MAKYCLFLILMVLSVAPYRCQEVPAKTVQPEPRLTIETNKNVYKFGEPILIRYTLSNEGKSSFYVSPSMQNMTGAEAGVSLDVRNKDGQHVVEMITSEVPSPDYSDATLGNYIPDRWLLFHPGMFYGGFLRNYMACSPKPGRYKIQATYFNKILSRINAEQRKSIENLPFPIVTGSISSNTLSVQVVGQVTRKDALACSFRDGVDRR